MPDELNERLNKQIEIEETEIIPEPLNQIVFRTVLDIAIPCHQHLVAIISEADNFKYCLTVVIS